MIHVKDLLRQLRPPGTFDGKQEDFETWSKTVRSYLCAFDPGYEELLTHSEESETELTLEAIRGIENEERRNLTLERSARLYQFLAQ